MPFLNIVSPDIYDALTFVFDTKAVVHSLLHLEMRILALPNNMESEIRLPPITPLWLLGSIISMRSSAITIKG